MGKRIISFIELRASSSNRGTLIHRSFSLQFAAAITVNASHSCRAIEGKRKKERGEKGDEKIKKGKKRKKERKKNGTTGETVPLRPSILGTPLSLKLEHGGEEA